MSNPPDMDELAKRFLDLWQQNLTAAASDPDMAQSMGQFMSQFNPAAWGDTQKAGEEDAEKIDIAAMLASIDRRLAAIELRLDRIETLAAKAAKPKAKPKKAEPKKGK